MTERQICIFTLVIHRIFRFLLTQILNFMLHKAVELFFYYGGEKKYLKIYERKVVWQALLCLGSSNSHFESLFSSCDHEAFYICAGMTAAPTACGVATF